MSIIKQRCETELTDATLHFCFHLEAEGCVALCLSEAHKRHLNTHTHTHAHTHWPQLKPSSEVLSSPSARHVICDEVPTAEVIIYRKRSQNVSIRSLLHVICPI